MKNIALAEKILQSTNENVNGLRKLLEYLILRVRVKFSQNGILTHHLFSKQHNYKCLLTLLQPGQFYGLREKTCLSSKLGPTGIAENEF